MFERPHLQLLTSRMNEPRRFIQVILGPRQVGKTTLVNQLATELSIANLFVSADAIAASDTIWLRQQWETARLKAKQEPTGEI